MSQKNDMATSRKASAAAQPQAKDPKTDVGADVPTALYVVGACPVNHDGELFSPGEEVELTESQALRLGSKVTPVATPLPKIQPTE